MLPGEALAQGGGSTPASTPGIQLSVEGVEGWEPGRLTRVIEIAALITALSFLPALLLTATCFTRFAYRG